MFLLDTERFIQCVKNNPTLWKKTSRCYGDRVMRERCWNVIGRTMYESWDEKTHEERQEEVVNMKNKWRHMRDSYNKYINQGKSRFGKVKQRRYLYADKLSFLLQRGNRAPNKGTQDEESKDSNDEAENSVETPEKPQTTIRRTYFTKLTHRPLNNQKQQIVKNPPIRDLPIRNSPIKNSPNLSRLEDDPDRCYLLSLLPEFKRLSDDEKLDFRFHTLQFFRVVRSKRLRKRPRGANGWSEGMECDVEDPISGNHQEASANSPAESPRASPGSNSPRESEKSDQSNEYEGSPPHFESVKAELL